MSDGRKRVESFYWAQKTKSLEDQRKIHAGKKRQNLAETDRNHITKEEWSETFLDSKGVFCNGNESDNHESYNENNEQQQLPKGFANSCYKIVSLILLQKLINNFVVCKHSSRTLLLAEVVSHGLGNQSYIFQK